MTIPTTVSLNRPQYGVLRLVLTVFVPFAGGYFLSYLYRSANAVIAPQLIREVGFSAADLGLLTAVYFLSFAAFQIPLGILLDRFGPRRVQTCLLLSVALGAAVFAIGETKAMLIVGRALIGLGVAGGFLTSFKAITVWFPKERWPLVNGCFMAMGGLGAMAATQPIEMLLGYTDWRGIFAGLSAATCCAAAAIFLVVPETSIGITVNRLRQLIAESFAIYTARMFWRLAPVTVIFVGSSLALQTLWAGPWLKDVAGFGRDGVAGYLFVPAATLIVGFVTIGVMADLLARVGISLFAVMAVGLGLFMVAQAMIVFQLNPAALWPWILFGLTCNVMVLVYPQLCRHFPLEYAGRVNTGVYVLLFGGASLMQDAIGTIIDLLPLAADGSYVPESYRAAFGGLLALQVVTFLWFLWAGRRPA